MPERAQAGSASGSQRGTTDGDCGDQMERAATPGSYIDWDAARRLRARLEEIGKREVGTMFLGKPDRWYEDPHWRCVNGHVSTFYLNSEAVGACLCLAAGCFQPLYLTFPEDKDGPLEEENHAE